VAIEFPVQRLQIGDVVALSEQGSEVEATVVREIDRTELTVRVTLRVEGARRLHQGVANRRDGHGHSRPLNVRAVGLRDWSVKSAGSQLDGPDEPNA
jgi:hypothetical protein